MAEPDNIVLEHLRAIRAKLAYFDELEAVAAQVRGPGSAGCMRA